MRHRISDEFLKVQRLYIESRTKLFWIDAIGIDRGNTQERDHQVKGMRIMYEQVLRFTGGAHEHEGY